MATRISLALVSGCFAAFPAFSQPVLDFNVEPVIGNKMEYVGTNILPYTDPGPSGPNQVWALPSPSAPFANLKQDCITPAGTPFVAQYPGAKYCVKTLITGSPTRFAYYSKTDSSIRLLGQSFLGNIVYKNIPAWEQIYPLNYGAIKDGQFSGTLKIGTQTTYFRTTFRQHYDGFGSISLGGNPKYDQAMRVKTLLTRIDSLPAANGAHTRTVVTEEFYKWFVEDIPGYVVLTSQVNAVQMTIAANGDTSQFQQFPPQFSNEWQSKFSVGTETPSGIVVENLFAVAGNPASDWLTIVPSRPLDQAAELSITGQDGRALFNKMTMVNEERIDIPVSSYPDGVYIVSLRTTKGIQSIKWVKQ